jgi:ech hydrogenase subunit E
MTTGGRLIFSVNKVGGVVRDITSDQMKFMISQLAVMEEEIKNIEKVFLNDYSVQSRSKGVGVLTKQQAHDLGCCGPFARASGINKDMRMTGYCAYDELDMEPIISTDGDCYARIYCRIQELYQSIDLIRQAVSKIPEGEISVNVPGFPKGEYFMRIEQPRGEAVYYVKGNGTKILDRMRIRTPTYANIAGLCETLKGADYADVGPLVVSIDPCISCTER